MDSEALEFWLKIFGVVIVVSDIVIALMFYIWRRHVKEVDEQKVDLKKLAEDVGQKADGGLVLKMRSEFYERVREIEDRHAGEMERMEDKHRQDLERMEDKHHNEVTGLRTDMNGLATRLTEAISVSEKGVIRHIEAIGKGFAAQMAMLISLVEKVGKNNGN